MREAAEEPVSVPAAVRDEVGGDGGGERGRVVPRLDRSDYPVPTITIPATQLIGPKLSQ